MKNCGFEARPQRKACPTTSPGPGDLHGWMRRRVTPPLFQLPGPGGGGLHLQLHGVHVEEGSAQTVWDLEPRPGTPSDGGTRPPASGR